MSTTYETLDGALQDIASRSFHESATVIPRRNGAFEVADDHGTTFADETLYWDKVDGTEWPSNATDHSRLHESYEFYDNAGHIEYNLSSAVDDLREGESVTFAYVIVDDYSGDGEPVGWALVSCTHN